MFPGLPGFGGMGNGAGGFSGSSSSATGDQRSSIGFQGGQINFGNQATGAASGAGTQNWLLLAVVGVAAYVLLKRK
ncbi:hypothetical protein ORI99_01815 [Alishewanella sp. SMS9]|nr:hypothetical protein [Alishewanella sp. SMS9]